MAHQLEQLLAQKLGHVQTDGSFRRQIKPVEVRSVREFAAQLAVPVADHPRHVIDNGPQVRPGLAQALVQPPLRGDVREGGDDGTRPGGVRIIERS